MHEYTIQILLFQCQNSSVFTCQKGSKPNMKITITRAGLTFPGINRERERKKGEERTERSHQLFVAEAATMEVCHTNNLVLSGFPLKKPMGHHHRHYCTLLIVFFQPSTFLTGHKGVNTMYFSASLQLTVVIKRSDFELMEFEIPQLTTTI